MGINPVLENLRTMTKSRSKTKWEESILPKVIIKYTSPRVREVLKSKKLIVPSNVEVGSQYLYGTSHTGKTIHAHFCLIEWCKQQYLCGNDFSDAMFVSTSLLLNQLRCIIHTSGNPTELLSTISGSPFLVLDDLGTSKTTDWVLEQLYLLINTRYEFMLPTIFTSNYSLDELSIHLGDERIPSRIQAMCKIIKKDKIW